MPKPKIVKVTVSFLVLEDEFVEAEDAMREAFCHMEPVAWGCNITNEYPKRVSKYARDYFKEYAGVE